MHFRTPMSRSNMNYGETWHGECTVLGAVPGTTHWIPPLLTALVVWLVSPLTRGFIWRYYLPDQGSSSLPRLGWPDWDYVSRIDNSLIATSGVPWGTYWQTVNWWSKISEIRLVDVKIDRSAESPSLAIQWSPSSLYLSNSNSETQWNRLRYTATCTENIHTHVT